MTTRSGQFAGTRATYTGTRKTKLVIAEGGSVGNWRIYDGQGGTIDPDHKDNCVEINASYAVLTNFNIVDCKFQAIVTTKPHVVIRYSDISDWGEQEYFYPSAGKEFTGSKRLSLSFEYLHRRHRQAQPRPGRRRGHLGQRLQRPRRPSQHRDRAQ